MENQLTFAQKRNKFGKELADLLAGAAFPVIIQLVFSSTIIAFADAEDTAIRILAIIGGEIMLLGAYFIFGRQSGITAYKNTVAGERKRALDSSDPKALYKTGEYAVWKGFVIALISVVPFLIVQAVDLVWSNTVTEFMLRYCFGWAYYPLKYSGAHAALNLLWCLVPIAVHGGAYIVGKRKGERQQELLDATNPDTFDPETYRPAQGKGKKRKK